MNYASLYRSVLLPLHASVRGSQHVHHGRLLAQSQWWGPEQIADLQFLELKKLLRYVFESVSYYQRKYAAVGATFEDIRSLSDFAKLPVLTRQELKQNLGELVSTKGDQKLLSHSTGGSTGVPTRLFITRESFAWRQACRDRVYGWAGLLPGEPSTHLWGAPLRTATKPWKLKLYERFQAQEVFNTFSQDEHLWKEVVAQITRSRPRVIVGYVSSLESFADYLVATQRQLPPLAGVIAAAEPLFETTREKLQNAFGTKVFNTYGAREVMSIGGECGSGAGLHINSENVLVETGDSADSAECSNVYVTDLHNYGSPLLRYEIGDAATLTQAPCDCGRGLPRLRRIEGRSLDIIRTPSGRTVPGELFPHLLKDFPEIAQFQVRQTSISSLEVSIVSPTGLTDSSSQEIATTLRRVLGAEINCRLTAVEKIPVLNSGKRRVVIGLPQ